MGWQHHIFILQEKQPYLPAFAARISHAPVTASPTLSHPPRLICKPCASLRFTSCGARLRLDLITAYRIAARPMQGLLVSGVAPTICFPHAARGQAFLSRPEGLARQIKRVWPVDLPVAWLLVRPGKESQPQGSVTPLAKQDRAKPAQPFLQNRSFKSARDQPGDAVLDYPEPLFFLKALCKWAAPH